MSAKEFPAVQVEEGKWYALDNPEVQECCDCGLVHRTEFKLEGSRIFWRTVRDDRQTRIQRKLNGITIKTKPVRPVGGG